ncbi:MAG: VCBS repeat-containing protein [Verrucomicrobiales bacterium]|nr:VCBS repeat-containing protein [Verrucomicrobiales bacterium]
MRWTLTSLCLLAVLGTGLGVYAWLGSRPAAYRPDERPEDITNELARHLPPSAPRPRLTDVTQAAGLAGFRNFTGDRTSQLPEDLGPGAAWGDFDNDGDDDLFLVSAGGALNLPLEQLEPCALFENLGNGSFRRVETFPVLRVRGLGAAWGDYNSDGYLDLVVTGYDALRLFRNEQGTGRFTADPRLPDAKGFWAGATWGDFNRDRRLDLYVCNYVAYIENDADRAKLSDQIGTAVPFTLNPASYPGGRNALYRQNPDGTFTDVAPELSVQNANGRSLGALWHDFDQDGWLDLYVANDVSDNVFYRNTGGAFEDLSHPAWVADYRSAMGLAAGDFDRDGDDDLFITHWVAQENGLYGNLWADLRRPAVSTNAPSPPRPPASADLATPRTNAIPPVRFVDIADQKGLGHVALALVGWGTEFVDLDHDGWLDLLVANGSTLEVQGSAPRTLQPQAAMLFWNEQGRHFHNLAPLHPGLSQKHVSRGLACADFDLDGDPDFLIADLYEGVRLYRNDMAAGHWLKIRLRSRNLQGQPVGFGEGSTVIAWVGDTPLRRTVGSVSYLSQSSHTLHWGLGARSRVDRLEIRWHAGGTSLVEQLEAGGFYEIQEGPLSASPPTPFVGAEVTRLTLPPPPPVGAEVTKLTLPPPPSVGAEVTRLTLDDRDRLRQFWTTQRAAMDALKRDQDQLKAIELLRAAIALNPRHEDSRYYLALALAGQGEVAGALATLEGLQQLNPQSHRAWQQWGILRASLAATDEDLAAAEAALERAHRLNPEETGALLVLGEVALLRGDHPLADDRLAAATRTNPRAAGGFFLRGYLAWKRGDETAARKFLEQTRAALGPDWQPEGATSEGDVQQKQHVEPTPLAGFWERWNGQYALAPSFAALEDRLGRAP